MRTMKAVVFHGINDLRVEEVPKPQPKPGEAVIRITATTICGTDVHIVKGEYPVRPGLILGHEPVGIIEELGEWRFGNTINGAWAEYLLVPDARANLAHVPDALTDEQVLMLPDIASTGISGAESGNVRTGDSVAIFAQGPIGLCATLGAKLRGAGLIIAVDPLKDRREMARRFGATHVINVREQDPVAELRRLTSGRGVDVAIEALGRQDTF